MALLGSTLIGCTRVSDEMRFESEDAQIEILASVPPPDAVGVGLRPQLDLCWSGLVDPRSLGDLDALVNSGSAVVDTDLELQLRPWRGPADAEEPVRPREPWCAGSVLSVTPKADLVAGVQYRLRLAETAAGWSGESIDTQSAGWIEDDNGDFTYLLEFRTEDPAPDGGAPDEKPPPPTLADLFAPGGVFDPDRPICSCHRDPDSDAMALLDLTTQATAFDDLVRAPAVRDTGFPMVTPRLPSESFLVHKLLRDDDGSALFGVRGTAMPQGGDPIPYDDYVAIARWIEGGAVR